MYRRACRWKNEWLKDVIKVMCIIYYVGLEKQHYYSRTISYIPFGLYV